MRRLVNALAALGVLAFAGEVRAEQLTVALSTNEIRIDSNFTGHALTVFGVIERDLATVSRATGYDVAVVMRGPPESVVAWRKERILGVWANRTSETILATPSFYSVSTSPGFGRFSTGVSARRLEIGFDNISLAYVGRAGTNDPAAAEFRDAFLRLKRQAALYVEQPQGVSFMGGSVFRTTFWIPANVPDGRYTVSVYLFSGEVILAQASDVVEITKTGFEQYMYAAAHQQALLYGLVCVLLALTIGWLAGVIFRRD